MLIICKNGRIKIQILTNYMIIVSKNIKYVLFDPKMRLKFLFTGYSREYFKELAVKLIVLEVLNGK